MDKITIKEPYQHHASLVPGEPLIVDVQSLAQVSDGYHTVEQLYDHRITLYIALCSQLSLKLDIGAEIIPGKMLEIHKVFDVWRSKTHSDGKPAYEGWFIMGIGKEKGEQISYHIPLERWDETNFAETLAVSPEWDGHTSTDVLERLKSL